nr:synaptophysin-like protein 1 isoform X1 [Caretta caretta]
MCGLLKPGGYLQASLSLSPQKMTGLQVNLSPLLEPLGFMKVLEWDLVITVMAAFLWLVSTSAWAKALTDIKISTGPSIVQEIASCKLPGSTCLFASVTSMGTLNVSVAFGLLNMILWGGNAWFVYKETSLHNPSNSTSQSSGIYPPTTGI